MPITPAYKLVIYAPRREDATEQTVLVPAPGAPHSDPCQLTTLPEGVLPGFRPFLQMPKGRTGRMDLRTRKTDTGSMAFDLVDARVGATLGNAERWFTAFTGDTRGRNRLLGCRAQAWESLDGGATWSEFWVGRVLRTPLNGRASFTVTVRDAADDLNHDVFTDAPHASVAYAHRAAVLPNGLVAAYGAAAPTAWGVGSIRTPDATTSSGQAVDARHVAYDRTVVISSMPDGSDWLTESLKKLDAAPRTYVSTARTLANRNARAVVKRLDTGAVGSFRLRRWFGTGTQGLDARVFDWQERDEGFRVTRFGIQEMLPGEPGYMAAPPANTAVEFYIVPGGDASEDSPVLITDVHPVQLISDLAAGKFARLKDAAVQPHYVHPVDTAGFAALIADTSFRKVRGIFPEPEPLREVLTEICLASGLAWRVDGAGRIVLTDLRLTSTAFVGPTITRADLVDTEAPGFTPDAEDQLTRLHIKYYVDEELTDAQVKNLAESSGRVPAGRITTTEDEYIPVDLAEELIQAERSETLDLRFVRVWRREIESTTGADAADTLRARLQALEREIRAPFAYGGTTVALPCRRSDVTSVCQPGLIRMVDVDVLPNPATLRRGGVIPMRCTARTENGGRLSLEFTTLPESIAAAPALGALSLAQVGTGVVADVPVTLNGNNESAEVWYCLTTTSVGVRPAEAADGWMLGGIAAATGTVSITGVRNRRVWVRGRSAPAPFEGDVFRLPSPYVFPPGAGYVDAADLAALAGSPRVFVDDASGAVDVEWTGLGTTPAVRIHYGIGPAGTTPALTSSYDTNQTTPTLPGVTVLRGQVIRVEVEPWSGWTGAAVTGTAGVRRQAEAERANAPDPSIAAPSLTVSLQSRADTTETWRIVAAVAPGASTPLLWRVQSYDSTAPVSPYASVPGGTLDTTVVLDRHATRVLSFQASAVDGDGRVRNDVINTTPQLPAVDPVTGRVDPILPLKGGKAIFQKAGVSDPDTADSVPGGTNYRIPGTGYVDSSGRVNTLWDGGYGVARGGAAIGEGVKRATDALTTEGRLQTGVESTADIAGTSSMLLAKSAAGVVFEETFETMPPGLLRREGAGTLSIVSGVGQTGGKVLQASGPTWDAFPVLVPFDSTKLYEFTALVRMTTAPSVAAHDLVFMAVEGVAADGTTYVSTAGANTYTGQHNVGCAALDMGATTLNTWVAVQGWFGGWAASGGATSTDPTAPAALHSSVRYFRPVMVLNHSAGNGVMQVDRITIRQYDREAAQRLYEVIDSTRKVPAPKVGPGAFPAGVSGKDDFAVGATSLHSVARHVEVVTGRDGATKTFAFPYASAPVLLSAALERGVVPTAGNRVEITAVNVTPTGFTARAVQITGGSSAARTDYFATTQNGTENPAGITLTTGGQAAYSNLDNATATATVYTVAYTIDCSAMTASSVTVNVYRNNGASSTTWTLVQSSLYFTGDVKTSPDEELSFTAALGANYDVKVEIVYTGAGGGASCVVKRVDYFSQVAGTESELTPASDDRVRFVFVEAP